MSEFEANKLRKEEELSGFNPGEPDDDTFTVSDEGYPGELPHLSDENQPDIQDEIIDLSEETTQIPEEEPEQIEEPVDKTDEAIDSDEDIDLTEFDQDHASGSDDSDEIETLQQNDIDVSEDDVSSAEQIDVSEDDISSAEQIDVPDEGSVWDAFGLDEETEETESQDTQEDESTDEPEQELDVALSDEGISDDEKTVETSPSEEITEEDIQADDELQALLMQDLERSKSRKDLKEAKSQQQEAERQEFIPVDDDKDAETIDISSLNYEEDKYNDIIDEDSSAKSTAATASEPKAKISEKKVINEDKKRSGFPWKLTAIASAALFLLTLGVIVVYLLMYKPEIGSAIGIFIDDNDTTQVDISKKSNIEKDAKKSSKKDAEKNIDTTLDAATDKETDLDSAKLSEDQKLKQDSINAAIEAYKQELAAKKSNDENIKIDDTDYKKKSSKKSTKKKLKAKPKTKVITKKDNNENVDLAKKETFTTPDASDNKRDIKTLNEIEEEGVFVVQIYSSPSKDDAEEWLNKLKAKNIQGFISEHKVRDKIWYRVRFGEFNSKDEARAAAMKHGYAQSWIDRIR